MILLLVVVFILLAITWYGWERCALLLRPGHEAQVSSIHMLNGNMYSASMDGTVRVWSISASECKQVINAHDEPIVSLTVQAVGPTNSNETILVSWYVGTLSGAPTNFLSALSMQFYRQHG